MTDPRDDLSEAGLDRLLAERAGADPVPSDLMARVLEDALAEQPRPVARHRAGFAGVLSAIGGWPGAGGLIAASLVGLWIGVSPPALIEAETDTVIELFSTDMTVGWGADADLL